MATLPGRVHWMRNAQVYVPKGQQNMVSAASRQAFTQRDHPNVTQTMRHVADQLRDKWPKLGAFIDDSETDVLAYMSFPAQHRVKIQSTNPIERLNKMGYPGQQACGGCLAIAA